VNTTSLAVLNVYLISYKVQIVVEN